MNTMQQVIDHNLEVAHTFTVLELALFETYLLFAGILFASIFPQLQFISPCFYAVVTLLGTIYLIYIYISKNKNLGKRIQKQGWHIQLTKKFGVLDFTIYKLTVVAFGILLVQLFPTLETLNYAWYAIIVGFGAGYFIRAVTKK